METAQKEPPIINAHNNDHKGRGWLFCCCRVVPCRAVTTPALMLSVGCKLKPTARCARILYLPQWQPEIPASEVKITASQRRQRVSYCSAPVCYKGHFQKAICCALECQIWILVHIKRTAPHVPDSARKVFVNKLYIFHFVNYDSISTV